MKTSKSLNVTGTLGIFGHCDLTIDISEKEEDKEGKRYFPNRVLFLVSTFVLTSNGTFGPIEERSENGETEKDIYLAIGITTLENFPQEYSYFLINAIDHAEVYFINSTEEDTIRSGEFDVRPMFDYSEEFVSDLAAWVPRFIRTPHMPVSQY